MYGNDFWRQAEIAPEQVAYSTTHYIVIVTPKVWRDQAREETDRPLTEYSVVNRLYKTIESTANVLSTAIQYANTMEGILSEVTKEKEKVSANIVGIKSKNNPE